MSLIAAVLSICQKTFALLTQTNTSIGGLTGLVATTNTINANTQLAAQASATQTGLSNQGYSAGRASYIDAPISSRSTSTTTYHVSGSQTYPGTGVQSTILNIAGSGEFNGGVWFLGGVLQGYIVRVICDGNVVCDCSYAYIPYGTSFIAADPSGLMISPTNATSWNSSGGGFVTAGTLGAPYCGFKFKSSLQVQMLWYNVGTVSWNMTYSLA